MSIKEKSTRKNFVYSLNNFNRFCKEKFDERSSEEIIQEVLTLKGEERESAVYEVLQSWVNWNLKNKMAASSIHNNFSYFKNYLYFRGIKITNQDIKENIDLPRIPREEKHPLSLEEIHKILQVANFLKKSSLHYFIIKRNENW